MEPEANLIESLTNEISSIGNIVDRDEKTNSSTEKTPEENETKPSEQMSADEERNAIEAVVKVQENVKTDEESLEETKVSHDAAKEINTKASPGIGEVIHENSSANPNETEKLASSESSKQVINKTENQPYTETDEQVPKESEVKKMSLDENLKDVIGIESKKLMEVVSTTCKSNSFSDHVEIEEEVIDTEHENEIVESSDIVAETAEQTTSTLAQEIQKGAPSSFEAKPQEEINTNGSSNRKEELLQDESSNSSEKLNESKDSFAESITTTSDDSKVQKQLHSAGDDSEYETLEEDNLEEERPEEYGSDSEEGEEEDEDEEDGAGSDNRERSGSSSPEIVMNEERQAADGQESDKKERKLDHDEDKRDPQYIPKKGMFYEHDDRTADGEEQKKETPRDTKKGKVWDSKEFWFHDLYVESEQAMKSTEEIIAIYGYDIRKDDGPPKARRRRRYVKGPNKYERSWEDEQAYVKSSVRGGFRGSIRRERAVGRNSIGGGMVSHVQKEFEYKPSDFPAPKPKNSLQRYSSPPKEDSWDSPTEKSPRTPQSPQQSHLQHQNRGHNSIHRIHPSRPTQQSMLDKSNAGKSTTVQKSQFHTTRRDETKNEENKVVSGKQGDHPQFQIPQGQPSQRGRGRGRLGVSFRSSSGKSVGFSELNKESRLNAHDKSTSHFNPIKSTADEDIATLAQHFSQAVINIDNKNIIRTTTTTTSSPVATQSSKPLSLTQVVQQHQQQQQRQHHQQHQQQQQLQSGTVHVERYKLDEQTSVDKGEQQRSKRYSTQRQRALPTIQHGQVGGPSNGPPNQQQPQQQQQQQQPGVVPPGMPPPPQHVPPPPTYMHQQPPPPPTAYYHAGCVESDVVAAGQVQPVEVVTFLQPPPPLHYVQPQFIQTPTGPIAMQTPPPPAGPEMYQGGGITYYNTLSQMTQSRPSCGTSRRLKVAIPIVAPPQEQQQQTAGGSGNAHAA